MVTAAPVFLNPDLTVTTKPFFTATLTAGTAIPAGTLFEFFDTCNVYLVGQKDPLKSPAKELATWWTANASALASKGLITTTYVSSWAIVVDITWKDHFITPVRYKSTTNDQVIPDPTAVDG